MGQIFGLSFRMNKKFGVLFPQMNNTWPVDFAFLIRAAQWVDETQEVFVFPGPKNDECNAPFNIIVYPDEIAVIVGHRKSLDQHGGPLTRIQAQHEIIAPKYCQDENQNVTCDAAELFAFYPRSGPGLAENPVDGTTLIRGGLSLYSRTTATSVYTNTTPSCGFCLEFDTRAKSDEMADEFSIWSNYYHPWIMDSVLKEATIDQRLTLRGRFATIDGKLRNVTAIALSILMNYRLTGYAPKEESDCFDGEVKYDESFTESQKPTGPIQFEALCFEVAFEKNSQFYITSIGFSMTINLEPLEMTKHFVKQWAKESIDTTESDECSLMTTTNPFTSSTSTTEESATTAESKENDPRKPKISPSFLWISIALGTLVLILVFIIAFACYFGFKSGNRSFFCVVPYLVIRQCFARLGRAVNRSKTNDSRSDRENGKEWHENRKEIIEKARKIGVNVEELPYNTAEGLQDKWEVTSVNLQIFDERLGAGAFAVVFKGYLRGIPPVAKIYPAMQLSYFFSSEGNHVAVKMCHENVKPNEKEDFLEEIKFMKKLEYNPHILSLMACSTSSECPLIVTAICELGDLLTIVREMRLEPKKSPLTFDDLVPIAWQISDALVFLSEKNVIHRDVAARNVLVTKRKMAKLSDFGLCRFQNESLYQSRGGKLPIKWMAPESIEFSKFSAQSDSWSYGVFLYELYSFGKTPFHSIDNRDVLAHLKGGNRLEIPDSAPKLMKSLMKECWVESPENRIKFQSIREQCYQEMEDNATRYGYLHISKNYYQAEPANDTEIIQISL